VGGGATVRRLNHIITYFNSLIKNIIKKIPQLIPLQVLIGDCLPQKSCQKDITGNRCFKANVPTSTLSYCIVTALPAKDLFHQHRTFAALWPNVSVAGPSRHSNFNSCSAHGVKCGQFGVHLWLTKAIGLTSAILSTFITNLGAFEGKTGCLKNSLTCWHRSNKNCTNEKNKN